MALLNSEQLKTPDLKEIIKESGKILQLSDVWIGYISSHLDEGKLKEEKTFMQWFKSNFVCIPFYLTTLLSAFVIAAHIFNWTEKFDVKDIAYIYEAGLLFIIILNVTFVNKQYKDNKINTTLHRGISSSLTFLSYWPWIWVSWFLLYSILAATKVATDLMNPWFSQSLIDAFNNLSGVVLFSMYFELALETQNQTDKPSSKTWLVGILLVFIFFVIELIVLKSTAHIDSKTKLESLDSHYVFQFSLWYGLAIGILTGLFVGRLESIIFNIPAFFIVYFILFAVIQPTFAFLVNDEYKTLSLILLVLALYGKMFLLIIVHWIRDTDRLLYYTIRRHRLYVQETKHDFRKIFLSVVNIYEETELSPVEPIQQNSDTA